MAENLGTLFVDGESTIEDENGNHTISTNVSVSTTKKKFGSSSIYVDEDQPVADYILVPSSLDFALGTRDFTIDLWFNIPSISPMGSYAFANIWDTGEEHFWFGYNSANMRFEIHTSSSTSYNVSNLISSNTWYHVALVRDGNTLKLYKDGSQIGSDIPCSDNIGGVGEPFRIGPDGEGNSAKHYIDNFRYAKDETLWTSNFNTTEEGLFYPSSEPEEPYTGPYTGPYDGNLGKLFIDAEDAIWDITGNHTLSSNFSVNTDQKKAGNSSIYMPQNSDNELSVPAHADFDLADNNFTIDFWFYTTNGEGMHCLVSKFNESDGYSFRLWYSEGQFAITCNDDSDDRTIELGSLLPSSTWHHIAVVRESTVIKLYLNGDQLGSNLPCDLTFTGASDDLEIGHNPTGNIYTSFYMDNFRYAKEALWTENFETTDAGLLYLAGYERPDTVSGLFNIGNRGNIRGKAAEGYIRPTLKQFFKTVPNYEEIESATIITSDTFENLDNWKMASAGGSNAVINNNQLRLTGQQGQLCSLQHKGVIEGDFDFTIVNNVSLMPATHGGHIYADLSYDDRWVSSSEYGPTTGMLRCRVVYSSGWTVRWDMYSPDFASEVVLTEAWQNSRFRFRRTGSTTEVLYYINSNWTSIKSTTYLGTNDLYLTLGAGAWGSRPSSTGIFDDLTFSSGNLKIY